MDLKKKAKEPEKVDIWEQLELIGFGDNKPFFVVYLKDLNERVKKLEDVKKLNERK